MDATDPCDEGYQPPGTLPVRAGCKRRGFKAAAAVRLWPAANALPPRHGDPANKNAKKRRDHGVSTMVANAEPGRDPSKARTLANGPGKWPAPTLFSQRHSVTKHLAAPRGRARGNVGRSARATPGSCVDTSPGPHRDGAATSRCDPGRNVRARSAPPQGRWLGTAATALVATAPATRGVSPPMS